MSHFIAFKCICITFKLTYISTGSDYFGKYIFENVFCVDKA